MKRSSKVESQAHAKYLELIQQFKILEIQWKSLQNSKPRIPRTSLITSDISSITSFHQLLENSPKQLMSSLQNLPSDRILRVRTRNVAVEEILSDRRAAIMTGKLKGRRLFGSAEEEEELFGMNHGCGSVCSEAVAFNQCCSVSDSSPSEEKVVVVEEEKIVEVAEKRGGDRWGRSCGGCMVPMVWLALVLILIIVGHGKCVIKNELILVPT